MNAAERKKVRALLDALFGRPPSADPPKRLVSNKRRSALGPHTQEQARREMARGWHWHKCGFGEIDTPLGRRANQPGCGYEWAHSNDDTERTDEQHEAAHHCPNCGRGFWGEKFWRSRRRS